MLTALQRYWLYCLPVTVLNTWQQVHMLSGRVTPQHKSSDFNNATLEYSQFKALYGLGYNGRGWCLSADYFCQLSLLCHGLCICSCICGNSRLCIVCLGLSSATLFWGRLVGPHFPPILVVLLSNMNLWSEAIWYLMDRQSRLHTNTQDQFFLLTTYTVDHSRNFVKLHKVT